MSFTESMVELDCPDSLSQKHLDQFSKIGYVAFESVLTTDEITELRLAMTEITHRLTRRARSGEADISRSVSKNAPAVESVSFSDPDSGYEIQFEPGIEPLSLSICK